MLGGGGGENPKPRARVKSLFEKWPNDEQGKRGKRRDAAARGR